MNSIYLEHNPFTVESTFLINGVEPADAAKAAQQNFEDILADLE